MTISSSIYLFKGFLIGFAIAAPVGPIGVLCIRRTLAYGRLNGFLSGLGAATADSVYCAVVAFSLTAVQSLLIGIQSWLHLIGGLFLIYLGLRTFLTTNEPYSEPEAPTIQNHTTSTLLAAYLSALGLTLTNPATILSFIVIFMGLRLVQTGGSFYSAGLLVMGVFLGSAVWWMTLSGLVGLMSRRFTQDWMVWVDKIAGTIIFGFGIFALTIK